MVRGSVSVKHIHKLVGYGLTFKPAKAFDSPLLNPDGFIFCKDAEDEYHLRHFYTFLSKKDPNKWINQLYSMQHFQPYLTDCIHLLPELGIICLCPPDRSNIWHRKDDLIDAVETKPVDNYTLLDSGIPPFLGFYDIRTGKEVDKEEVEIFIDKSNRLLERDVTEQARKRLTLSLRQGAKRMGFKDPSEAFACIAPLVPEIVLEFCRFLKLFKDEETIGLLRPMLVTYWK
jgi:hypothetical protein